ncbi:hypothetical protein L7F22_051696 [Adiantum nelumboides]|nr:hypothetical protein [Adiantum nelumboides]
MDGNKEEGSSSEDRQPIPTAHEIGESSSQAEEGFPHAAFSITGIASPGTLFGGMQSMVPNPMYANIGLHPGFQGTQGQFGVSQGNLGMAGFSIPPVNMAPRHHHVTGQGVQMAPTADSSVEYVPSTLQVPGRRLQASRQYSKLEVSEEEVGEVPIGSQEKTLRINKRLLGQLKEALKNFLLEFKDVFALDHTELKGIYLRKELQNVVASVDVGAGLDNLVETATRAEKRFGVNNPSSSKKKSKMKKEKGRKKKTFADDSSEDESNSDLYSDTDADTDLDTEQQLCHLRENAEYIMEEKDFSPKLVVEVFKVPLTPPPSSFVKILDVQSNSKAKRWKLDCEIPFRDKSKAAMDQGIKTVVGIDEKMQLAGKVTLSPLMIGVPKLYTKSRTITLSSWKASKGSGEQTLVTQAIKTTPFAKTASAKLDGVFSVQDAVKGLSDLNRFICNQEAMILTLETQKAEGKQIDSLEQEVSHLQSKVDEVLKEKTTLQEELAWISADMQNQIADMLRKNFNCGQMDSRMQLKSNSRKLKIKLLI